jgi:hypothetical protein
MKRIVWLWIGAVAMLAMAGAAEAQEESRFGIGFQSSWPAYEISGLHDVNDRITAQAVVGAFGTLSTLSGRVLYNFQKEEKHALYGYGTSGVWRHSFRSVGFSDSETSFGAGGGAGVELNWRNIVDDSPDSTFPRLFSSLDIGFVTARFDWYDFSGITIGGGIHYRF